MVNNVSEKYSTPIFWTETKFNSVQLFLPCKQEQQHSPTSLNIINGNNLSFHRCKTLIVACPIRSCKRPSDIFSNDVKAVVRFSHVCLYI